MSDFFFRPNPISYFYMDWTNPATWAGGFVPNSNDADVKFQTTILSSSGDIYRSGAIISKNTSIVANTLSVQSHILNVEGSLSVNGQAHILASGGGGIYVNVGGSFTSGNLTVDASSSLESSGSLTVSGTMTTGTLLNNGSIQGHGVLKADTMINNANIYLDRGAIINSDSFANNGDIFVGEGGSTINTLPGGFSALTTNILSSGTYHVGSEGGERNILNLNVGQQIAATAVPIALHSYSTIFSVDPATGQAVSLQSSLHDILPQGSLSLSSGAYAFGPLNVGGALNLQYGDATVSSTNLTIGSTGILAGTGTVASSVTNDGIIKALPPITFVANDPKGILHLQQGIQGSGSLLIGSGALRGGGTLSMDIQNTPGIYNMANLQIGGPTAQNVAFENNVGQLSLNDVYSFTGTISPSNVGAEQAEAGDRILLSGISQSSITSMNYIGSATGGTLTLNQATNIIQLKFEGNFNLGSFKFTPISGPFTSDPQSLQVTVNPGVGVACFVSGSMIGTPTGEVAVEDLEPGDLVVTTNGIARPIIWIGSRTITAAAAATVADREWWPVRIEAHAFGTGMPSRALLLSPGHCICIDMVGEIFIPMNRLVNGHSITQAPVDAVTYWHVELGSQDVILANGLPSETYLDVGNREAFERKVAIKPAHITVTPGVYCRPRFINGPIIDAVRNRIEARSVKRGWTLTNDMDIHLIVDGERIDGDLDGNSARFLFSAGAKMVHLMSDTFCPAEALPDTDSRMLGIALKALSLSDGLREAYNLPLDHAVLANCHPVESDAEHHWRWTDGCQPLPAHLWRSFRSHVILRIEFRNDASVRWIAPHPHVEEPAYPANNVVAFSRG